MNESTELYISATKNYNKLVFFITMKCKRSLCMYKTLCEVMDVQESIYVWIILSGMCQSIPIPLKGNRRNGIYVLTIIICHYLLLYFTERINYKILNLKRSLPDYLRKNILYSLHPYNICKMQDNFLYSELILYQLYIFVSSTILHLLKLYHPTNY